MSENISHEKDQCEKERKNDMKDPIFRVGSKILSFEIKY